MLVLGNKWVDLVRRCVGGSLRELGDGTRSYGRVNWALDGH
jgi:hypothetical protein